MQYCFKIPTIPPSSVFVFFCVIIKPLYYFIDNKKFVFASEQKAILEQPAFDKKINKDKVKTVKSIYKFLKFVIDPKTKISVTLYNYNDYINRVVNPNVRATLCICSSSC